MKRIPLASVRTVLAASSEGLHAFASSDPEIDRGYVLFFLD